MKRSDLDLHYELNGDSPPVPMTQGVGAIDEAWRPPVRGLATNFRTQIFDKRGIGRSLPCRGPVRIESMAADARELMDGVGGDSTHATGHSMGAVIAQQLALDVPRRVRSPSLLCTFARGKDGARLSAVV